MQHIIFILLLWFISRYTDTHSWLLLVIYIIISLNVYLTKKEDSLRLQKLQDEWEDLRARLLKLEQDVSNIHTFRQPETTDIPLISPESNNYKAQLAQLSQELDAATPNTIAQTTPPENNQNTEHSSLQQPKHPRPKSVPASDTLIDWLTRGNLLLKVGVLLLFLGIAFLLRYVHSAVPLSFKYLAIASTGVAAIVLGLRFEQSKREYGLAIQGLGFAVLYLTALAALKLHALVHAPIVLGMMTILVATMITLAVRQNAKIMAQVALIGGLSAPLLTSDGSGNHIFLFLYLTLLNTAIAIIARFKAWRSLNLIGFAGTLIIATVWSKHSYRNEFWLSCEFFLVYHWLLYTTIACLFAFQTLKEKPLSSSFQYIPNNASLSRIWKTIRAYGSHISGLDSTLLFGTALASFSLQFQLLAFHEWLNLAALGAMIWASVYVCFAWYFFRQPETFSVIKYAFSALTLVFITLAIALQLESNWTASTWSLEAALIYIFSLIQRQPHTRLAALIVFIGAAIMQLAHTDVYLHTVPVSWFGEILTLISGTAIYFSWTKWHRKNSAIWEANIQAAALVLTLSNILLFSMITFTKTHAHLALAVYTLVFALAQYRAQVRVLTVFSLISAVLTYNESIMTGSVALASGFMLLSAAYFLHQSAWLPEKHRPPTLNSISGWCILILGWYLMASGTSNEPILSASNPIVNWVTFLLIGGLLALVAHWRNWYQMGQWLIVVGIYFAISMTIYYPNSAYESLSCSLIFAAISALTFYHLLPRYGSRFGANVWHGTNLALFALSWTLWLYHISDINLSEHSVWTQLAVLLTPLTLWILMTSQRKVWLPEIIYWRIGSAVAAGSCVLWLLVAHWQMPHTSGLPYLPVLNPLEIATAAIVWQWVRWSKLYFHEKQYNFTLIMPFILTLYAISSGVMRVWHTYDGVEWQLNALLASFGLQASLSIVWALLAIGLMVYGNQRAWRILWLTGATLLGVVVVKLFIVELRNSDSIARIVSFIVVGLLLLLVGWFAPAPSNRK